MTVRRRLPTLLALALMAAAALLYATTRDQSAAGTQAASADGCPPGTLSRKEQAQLERRERRGLEAQGAAAEVEVPGRGKFDCAPRKRPESQGELFALHNTDARRSTGGITDVLKPGAYREAVEDRRAMTRAERTLPGTAGTWEQAGKTPQIYDDERFGEVNGLGLADVMGRISDFASAPDGRVFAAVGEGGVWELPKGSDTWRSIGEGLPTQAVGSVGFSTADGGTIIASTGDSVFGGGGTFAGMGVYRTTDGGGSWQKAAGVPDGAISFKVAVDPTDQNVVYVASGAGLFRSADAGRTFENVALPTGKTDGLKDGAPLTPDCTGAAFGTVGCFQANMVTDVVVQTADNEATADDSAGAKGGSVVAVVGWRAGDKLSPPSDGFPDGYVESPNNGVYRSDTGAPGTFEKLQNVDDFSQDGTIEDPIGRIELGHASGPAQDHNYLYAIVSSATAFRNGTRGIDISGEIGGVPNNTNLNGIYVSDDFGESWTLMENAEGLGADPATGSALTGDACLRQLYCPGVQSWYNLFITPDPSSQTEDGVPTRLVFGLEEVWQNDDPSAPASGPTRFKTVGPYFAGGTCQFRDLGIPDCPTTAGTGGTTTHPDQHAAFWLPTGDGGDGKATLYVGNDGGTYAQAAEPGADVDPDNWGRGLNKGFDTLLPYDAQVAKDGVIYAGLQDNGELKIEPDGKQYGVYGGDGAFSAVDPDNSDVAYESYTYNAMSKTTDGGKTWTDVAPPDDSYQFINPFTMDPLDAGHILTAGSSVHETTDGAGSWETVFDLGSRKNRGSTDASSGDSDDPDNIVSAVDTRTVGTRAGGGVLKATPNVPDFEAGGDTVPGADAGRNANVPGTFVDREFTIADDESNKTATIEAVWDDPADDWDMVVLNEAGDEIGDSSTVGGESSSEKIVLPNPKPGTYTMRVYNYIVEPRNTFTGRITFQVADAALPSDSHASYVAFCGYCDALNTRPFDNGIATNVTPDGKVGLKGKPDNWHIAKAEGLPKRYITSVQVDPADPRTVYVTLAGYSRRWLPVGVLGENPDAGKGNVFKSTDAGETFANISGDLPDIPANWTLVRNGQLVVATNVGAFISKDTSGGAYEVLGTGLPTAPVFTLEMKPKAKADEPDVMIAATQGRGVFRYEFKDPAPGGGGGTTKPPGSDDPPGTTTPPPGSDLDACTPSGGIKTVAVRGRGRGLRLGFTRRTNAPVRVDVFRVSTGRRVIRERLVKRFSNRTASVNWNGRGRKKVGPGYYFVRYQMNQNGRRIDARRVVVRFAGGKWTRRPDFFRRDRCDLLRKFKLERPVFGGPKLVTLKGAYQLNAPARVSVTISKGSKVVRRYEATSRQARRTYRFSLPARNRARGDYRVRVRAVSANGTVQSTLTSRRL